MPKVHLENQTRTCTYTRWAPVRDRLLFKTVRHIISKMADSFASLDVRKQFCPSFCVRVLSNALSYAMLEALGTALMPSEDAKRDENLSCVVISAKGKVFSSGHDLSELVGVCFFLADLSTVY